jgi:hypothetical protein
VTYLLMRRSCTIKAPHRVTTARADSDCDGDCDGGDADQAVSRPRRLPRAGLGAQGTRPSSVRISFWSIVDSAMETPHFGPPAHDRKRL